MVKLSYISLIKLLQKICLRHPAVNDFYFDRYTLNHADNIRYAAIVLTTNSVNVGNNLTTASFNLLYADRLNTSRDNCLQVQAEALRVLSEITNALRNLDAYTLTIDNNLDFQLFKEGFADSTAGAWTQLSVSFHSEIGTCYWLDNDPCECSGLSGDTNTNEDNDKIR